MPGWIALHRDIRDHWLYEEKRVFSRFEAWTSILMRVNHSEGKVMHNGTLEIVERGSTIWSLGDMETEWGWSNTKVKRFMERLKNDEMVTYKSTTKKTYVTVINYDKYQHGTEEKTPPKHQQNTTETFQKHTNNNDKELKNEKELKDTTTTAAEVLEQAMKETAATIEIETVMDIHKKVFGTLFMSGLMSDYVNKLKSSGYQDTFIKELMLETGESGSNPSIRLMETIGGRWMKEGIYTRAESKRRHDEEKGKVLSFQTNKQSYPVAVGQAISNLDETKEFLAEMERAKEAKRQRLAAQKGDST